MKAYINFARNNFGTSNSGNTARVFFKNWQKSSLILKLCPKLIKNLSIILNNINSNSNVNIDNHFRLCLETFRIYTEKYSGFKTMTPTLHKILCHSTQFMQYVNVNVGSLSEESIESGHKSLRQSRLIHARKMSREENLFDILTWNHCKTDLMVQNCEI